MIRIGADKNQLGEFMDRLEHMEPDDVWLSPIRGLWSQTQELESLNNEAEKQLAWKRQWHEDHVLNFTRTVLN